MSRRTALFVVIGLIALLAVPLPAAAQRGSDRPFKATFSGWAHWEWPGTFPSDCLEVTTVTEATGQATHLGRVLLSSSHCPAEPLYVTDGRMTLTAANGDILRVEYDYDPTSTSNTAAVAWTGGTGRFANASGVGVMTFQVVPRFIPGCDPTPNPFLCMDFSVPWVWSATISGTITY